MINPSVNTVDQTNQPTVLVLDDEEAILASIRSLFRKYPYRIRLFTSINSALQQLRAEGADIVISDLRMNDSNGLEFMKEVVKVAPSAKRIMMSGFEDKSIVLLALSTGLINHFIYKPWEEAEFVQLVSKVAESVAGLTLRGDKDILYEFEDLPSPPRFQERLNQMLTNTNAPMAKIIEEIEMNPALVARLLRIANSVHLGIRKRVTSVKEAVLFIGMEYVASVVTALEAFQSYSSRVPERYEALLEEMSLSAVRRAMISRGIASKWPNIENKFVPHVASLLQDIGLIARICLRQESYDLFLKTMQEAGITAREAELKVFGNVTHERIGAAILDNWNFPPEIVDVVRNHHATTAMNDNVRIVQLATLLGGSMEGYPYDESLRDILPEWSAKLGLDKNSEVSQEGERTWQNL